MKKIILAFAIISVSGINVYRNIAHNKTVAYSDLQLENIELLEAFGDETGEQVPGATSHGCGNAAYMWIDKSDNRWSLRRNVKFKTCAPDCPEAKGTDAHYITC